MTTNSKSIDAFSEFISQITGFRTTEEIQRDRKKEKDLKTALNTHRSAKQPKRYSMSYDSPRSTLINGNIDRWPAPLFSHDGKKAVSIGLSEFSWPAIQPLAEDHPKKWARLVLYSLLGVAYSRTPVDLFKDHEAFSDGAKDDLYIFHFVSFNEELQSQTFKVGRSNDPMRRLATLRGSSGCAVMPVLILKGAGEIEPLVHKALSDRGIKGALSEFYFPQHLSAVLLTVAAVFQNKFHLDFCLEIQRSLDVCAARFSCNRDDIDYFCDIDSRIAEQLQSLANTMHPSFSGAPIQQLLECAPSQDTLSLDFGEHNGSGVLHLFFGPDFAKKVRKRTRIEDGTWPVLDMMYFRDDIDFISEMPLLSLNLLVRFIASLRLELRPIFYADHAESDNDSISNLIWLFTHPGFPCDALGLIPSALRCAEMGVDLMEIKKNFDRYEK